MVHSEATHLSLNDPVVARVQLALRRRGYYTGPINGFLGQNTQNAIQTFEVRHCDVAAPLVTRCLLVELGIGSDGKSVVRTEGSLDRQDEVID